MSTYKKKILSQKPTVYAVVSDDPLTNFGTGGGTFTQSTAFSGTTYNDRSLSTSAIPVPTVMGQVRTLQINTGTANPKVWTLSFVTDYRGSSLDNNFAMPDQFSLLQFDDHSTTTPDIRYQTYNSSNGGLITSYYTYAVGSGAVASNALTHWTFRRNGTNVVEVFRNGVNVGGPTIPWGYPTSDSVTFYYSTSIRKDHFAYFDRALSDEEIYEQAWYDGSPVGPSWTVLESGLEVPVTVEGEYAVLPGGPMVTPLTVEGVATYQQGNPASPLVTNADRFYAAAEAPAPVTTSSTISTTTEMTYSLWIKWNGTPAGTENYGIVAHQVGSAFGYHHNALYVNPGGRLYINTSNGVTANFITDHFTDGQWHHYALVVANGGNLHKAYADGVFQAQLSLGRSTNTPTTLNFGTMFSGTTQYGPVDGTLRDCAAIGSALSNQQIADIHAAGPSVFTGYVVEPL